jgi:tetratricopeptide (TPR) repeat protein
MASMRKLFLLPMAGLALICATVTMAQGQKAPKISKQENQALQNISKMLRNPATTAVQIEAAITEFKTNFPASAFLANAFSDGLQYYQTPPHVNYEKSLYWGEQTLKADPNNLYALTTVGDIIPANASSTDLDFGQRIAEATQDDNHALEVVQTAGATINGHPFPQAMKNSVEATAYSSLARIADKQQKYADEVANYQKAVPFDPPGEQAVDYFYMARAQIQLKQYTQALASLDACAKAAPDNAQVQQAVDSNRKLIAQLQKSGN